MRLMTTSATLHVMNMQSEIIYNTRSHYILRRHVRSTWNSSQVFSKLDRFAYARYSWLCAFKYFRSHQFSNPYFFALSQREPVTHKIFVLVSILMLACICKVLPVSLAEYLITSMHLRFYWIFWMVEVDHKPHFCEKCKDPIHSL